MSTRLEDLRDMRTCLGGGIQLSPREQRELLDQAIRIEEHLTRQEAERQGYALREMKGGEPLNAMEQERLRGLIAELDLFDLALRGPPLERRGDGLAVAF